MIKFFFMEYYIALMAEIIWGCAWEHSEFTDNAWEYTESQSLSFMTRLFYWMLISFTKNGSYNKNFNDNQIAND